MDKRAHFGGAAAALALYAIRSSRRAARRRRTSVTSVFVQRALARRAGVVFRPLYVDRWAEAVTRLAGDEIRSDATDNRLVALARAGRISGAEQLRLLAAHHRSVRGV
ncbi:hypothetical protein [Castellaniella sp. S9]|uniref:hypothetical protein n=1 Tax=Castellaniella sp. S9 TaxID=2993652 RepID=UPI0022B4FF1C|nr:hypothetical protein [Castellaniella sp. S9]